MNAYVGDPKWQWEVTCYYNDTVAFPKVPGDIAIQTVHSNETSKDLEVSVSESRTDVNIVVRYIGE